MKLECDDFDFHQNYCFGLSYEGPHRDLFIELSPRSVLLHLASYTRDFDDYCTCMPRRPTEESSFDLCSFNGWERVLSLYLIQDQRADDGSGAPQLYY